MSGDWHRAELSSSCGEHWSSLDDGVVLCLGFLGCCLISWLTSLDINLRVVLAPLRFVLSVDNLGINPSALLLLDLNEGSWCVRWHLVWELLALVLWHWDVSIHPAIGLQLMLIKPCHKSLLSRYALITIIPKCITAVLMVIQPLPSEPHHYYHVWDMCYLPTLYSVSMSREVRGNIWDCVLP